MLIDKITPDEMKIIDLMRHSVGDDDTDFFSGEYVDNNYFLRFWEQSKQKIYKAFGEKLILKKRISSIIEDDELYNRMRNLFYTNECDKVKRIITTMLGEINEKDWYYGSFVLPNENLRYTMRECFYDFVFNAEGWVQNKYEGPTIEVKLPNGQVFKMIYGCKIMKAIGRIVKSFNNPELSSAFETVRLQQSQIMNEANISANLCLSIHPLDYMTASYNNNDWRSCMNWDDGEFRRGVIEMMNSPIVIVAYIESGSTHLSWYNGADNPRLEWNSKRWREFFIVDQNLLSGIKGYPYWNRVLEDETLKWIREIFNEGDYRDEISIYKFPNGWSDGVRGYKDDNVDVRLGFDCGPAMYNDFYGGNEYHMIFRNNLSGRFDIFYSGESECVCCGESFHDFDGEGALVCNGCVEHYDCCKCGESIYREDDLIEFNGRYYCHYCYQQLSPCSNCGALMDPDFEEEDGFEFIIGRDKETSKDILYRRPNDFDYSQGHPIVFKVCSDCAKTIFRNPKDLFHTTHQYYSDWSHYHMIIPIEELTAEGLKMINSKDLEYFLNNKITETLSA